MIGIFSNFGMLKWVAGKEEKLDEVETLCLGWVWAWGGGLMTWVAGLRILFHSFVFVLSPCSMSFNEFVDTASNPHGVHKLIVCKGWAMKEGKRRYMQPIILAGRVSTASSEARHVFQQLSSHAIRMPITDTCPRDCTCDGYYRWLYRSYMGSQATRGRCA